jgi:hypothetical protein
MCILTVDRQDVSLYKVYVSNGELEMTTVTYTLYRRYKKEKKFTDVNAARGFFFGYCVKNSNVSSAEMVTV